MIKKHSHRALKSVFLLLMLLLALIPKSKGQTCIITSSSDVVCLGNSITLTASFNSNDSAWAWDFGDGKTSTQGPSVVYQYTSAGSFSPQLTVYRTGGTSCNTTKSIPVKVVNKPTAQFSVSADTLCFKDNRLCITDISTIGNAPISKRIVLFGDGSFDQAINTLPPAACHSYSNAAGGRYTVVMQVFDTNGCESSHIDSILVHARIPKIDFGTTYDPGCAQTPVLFTNNLIPKPATVKHFRWIFGDSGWDTSHWTGHTHVYSSLGPFSPGLIITDQNNCVDTFIYPNGVKGLTSDTSFSITKIGSSCVNANSYSFQSQTKAVVVWKITSPQGKVLVNSNMNPAGYTFPSCGRYAVQFTIRTNACYFNKDTFIDIYGPNTIIQNDSFKVKNGVQCGISDTVFFNNPFRDLNCYHQNGPMNRLWDFGDPYAPACTTDTKNGIFINTNCNFSKDSSSVWHKYKNGKDSCYKVKLIMMDPIRNCQDSDVTILSLAAPDAGWDSTITPPRRGMYTTGNKCLGQTVTFMLEELLPLCGPDRIWILPDSACFPHTWLLKDTTNKGTSYSYTYNTTCNPNGRVTYGVIVSNGINQFGQRCYDTAWYHNKLYFQPLISTFTVSTSPVPGSCSKNTAVFSNTDPVQYNLSKVEWNFGDGETETQYLNPGDSIIQPVSHTYNSSGAYTALCTVYNTNNCSSPSSRQVFLGRHAAFSVSKTLLCNAEPLRIIETVGYYTPEGNILKSEYWYDNIRITEGKESVLWDLGDGNGFTLLNQNPLINYAQTGNYIIKMMVRDSIGCIDTLISKDTIHVVKLQPHIGIDQTEYLCAPVIVLVNDSSKLTDSSAAFGMQPYDSIAGREWIWDDFKENSTLKNPAHFYTSNGNYTIRLKVTSKEGCVAYDSIPIIVKGPQPQFIFTGDTAGCVPLTITVKNTSGKSMLNWIWYFNDTNIYSTQNDSDVSFTYHRPGIYHVRLIGEDTVWNPITQSFKSCTAAFPDSSANVVKRDVRVIAVPEVKILTEETICLGMPFSIATENLDPYTKYFWEVESDVTVTKDDPDTLFQYIFTQPGKKLIKLTATSPSPFKCSNFTSKEVEVKEVHAGFDIKLVSESQYQFQNKSSGASHYEWNFGDERNQSENRSEVESPPHHYKFAPGPHTVCLTAFNEFGCLDSVCKQTPLSGTIKIPNVFTPNNDGQNDAFDIYIEGAQSYQLAVYNRWGAKVYETPVDGVGNDGVNWNGKESNTGSECPPGTYYYVFKYRLVNSDEESSSNGTITLLR
jgi:gliding motility-associated-like protein